MTYRTCPDCGSRVYQLGCVNCDEENYIAEQVALDGPDPRECKACHGSGTYLGADNDRVCRRCDGTGRESNPELASELPENGK